MGDQARQSHVVRVSDTWVVVDTDQRHAGGEGHAGAATATVAGLATHGLGEEGPAEAEYIHRLQKSAAQCAVIATQITFLPSMLTLIHASGTGESALQLLMAVTHSVSQCIPVGCVSGLKVCFRPVAGVFSTVPRRIVFWSQTRNFQLFPGCFEPLSTIFNRMFSQQGLMEISDELAFCKRRPDPTYI